MNLFKSHKIVSAMVVGSIVGHMVHAQEGGEVVNLAGKAQVSNLAAKASSMIDSGCVLVGYFNTPEAMKAQEPDYYSVSPRDVFEDGYTPVEGMNFGMAVELMKKGLRVARAGWNGAGMFVYIVPANSYPAQTGAAKAHFGENGMVPYREYMALKTAQGDVAMWAPSGSDALADDWVIVE